MHLQSQLKPATRFVVIGTSTGGLAALKSLLADLPVSLPAAVMITMHIGKHGSVLPSLLSGSTALKVVFAEDQLIPLEGHVYIAPPDRHLLMDRRGLRLLRGAKENHARPAIDPLFRSAAMSYRSNVIGVVLTGDLDDGTVGLQAIKTSGGAAIVQDPTEADAPGMPSSALRYVEIDRCLPLSEMGPCLIQMLEDMGDPVDTTTASPSEPYAKENQICFQGGVTDPQVLQQLGEASGLTCPDCGGGLWQMGQAPLRFRCHTGHSFTADTLQQEQDNVLEEAIWVAIRSLHEKTMLFQRQAASARNAGREESAVEYDTASIELEEHSATLRKLMSALGQTP